MKILNFLKTKKHNTINDTYQIELEISKTMVEKYSNYEDMKELIVSRFVEELYPQVKSELTNTKNIEKLINDLRLKIATEVFNKEVKNK